MNLIKSKTKKCKAILLMLLMMIPFCNLSAQDFGIFSLSAKTNLDSTDAFLIMQKVDSAYYKLLWDRVVDSVEDSIRGKIVNNWIKSNAAISLSKLASGTAAYIVLNNGSGVPTYTAVSGDITINSSGVVTISSNSIGSAEITNDEIVNADINSSAAIAYSKLNLSNSVVSGDITDGTLVNADVNSSAAIAYSKLNLTGSILNADINSSAGIALSKLATSTAGNIIVYNSGGVPTSTTVSGDISITDAGVVDLSDVLSDNFTFSGTSSFSSNITGFVGIKYSTYEITAPSGGSQTISALNRSFIVFSDLTYGNVSITDFISGVDGQVMTFLIPTNSYYGATIVANGSKIVLDGNVNAVLGVGSAISFIRYGNVWYETGRSENDLGY